MRNSAVLILGCGFTGRRVARRLAARGVRVTATTRRPEELDELRVLGARVERLEATEPESIRSALRGVEPGVRVLHSIPTVAGPAGARDATPALLDALGSRPERIVYLSTTGVYGAASHVDETTPVDETSPRERPRLDAEQAVAAGPWSWLVLRPAAIYGPGRGVHERIRRGTFRLVEDGANYVSRIHVEDLAALAEAALFSELTGAWPVADEEPCTSREMAEFCAGLLGVPVPSSMPRAEAHHTRRANRRVDGRAICRSLGVTLRYPSYRTGVPASL